MSLLPAIPEDGELRAVPPTVVVCGPGTDTAMHAHHVMHVLVAREGALAIEVAGVGSVEAPGVWILPSVPHAIASAGRELAMLFIDPMSREGRTLRRGATGAATFLDERARQALLPRWPRHVGAARDEAWAEAVLATLGAPRAAPPSVVHPGVRRALRRMHEDATPPDLAELARVAELSEGRLIHVFRDEVGIPPRRYLLWLKVQRATGELARGRPITEAAHAAGFADAAHLSRTFRRMFGLTPGELQRNSQYVQARS